VTAVADRVAVVLRQLERRGSRRTREEMLTRYGITAPKAFGVPVGVIKQIGKSLGTDHELALALWETGWYEARMLTAFVDDPAKVTAAQMDRWARDFDNWGICDTLCFSLFDRTPHAWRKVEQWAKRDAEFVKRAAFALLACLALHDKTTGDAPFLKSLALIERAADDDRNFVRKGVSWALRLVGRRNQVLNAAAVELCRRLAESDAPSSRWNGKQALRELTSPLVRRKVSAVGTRKPTRKRVGAKR
jgi:3-methyladenine DNA glycosylase AlkD